MDVELPVNVLRHCVQKCALRLMRRLAVELETPFFTTVQGARAAVLAMEHAKKHELEVHDLGFFHQGMREG